MTIMIKGWNYEAILTANVKGWRYEAVAHCFIRKTKHLGNIIYV